MMWVFHPLVSPFSYQERRTSFRYFFLAVPHVPSKLSLPSLHTLAMVPWPTQTQFVLCLTLLQIPQTSINCSPSNLKIIPCLLISWSGIQGSPYSDSKWYSQSLFFSFTKAFCHRWCKSPTVLDSVLCVPSSRPVLAFPHLLLLHDISSTNSAHASQSSPSCCSYTKSPRTPLQSLVPLMLTAAGHPFAVLGIAVLCCYLKKNHFVF